jgi:hypothetical protein
MLKSARKNSTLLHLLRNSNHLPHHLLKRLPVPHLGYANVQQFVTERIHVLPSAQAADVQQLFAVNVSSSKEKPNKIPSFRKLLVEACLVNALGSRSQLSVETLPVGAHSGSPPSLSSMLRVAPQISQT